MGNWKERKSKSQEELEREHKAWMEAGQFIKDLRNKQGYNVRELGDEVGVTGNHISEIERGVKPASDFVVRGLAKALYVDEKEIFDIYHRISYRTKELLREHGEFNTMIDTIKKMNLSDKQLHKLYNDLNDTFMQFQIEKEDKKK